ASDVEAMTKSLLGATSTSGAWLQTLISHTEGLPFFVVEYLRQFAERQGDPIGVPSSVSAMLLQTFSSLDADAKRALVTLAIAGREGLFDRLAPLLPVLQPHFEKLVALGILQVTERSFRFVHDKWREVALATVDELERSAGHARIAALLETRDGEDEG